MRTRQGETWSQWQALEVGAGEGSSGTEGDAVIDATEVEVRLTGEVAQATLTVWASPEEPLDSASLTRVDGTQVPEGSSTSPEQQLQSTGVDGPIIQTRAQWGADESIRRWSPNHIENPTLGVTIHHTAGTNDYTADQVPAILRGIYQYHAITRDWGDVGYTMLVDKYGRAWEGRAGSIDRPLRTAHAYGMNYTTAGISLLGDYDRVEVPTLGFEAMAAVTAWKLDAHGLSVDDTFTHTNDYFGWTRELPTVHAHRDVDSTACPGRFFVARMDEF
nr:N-acetylmuramoyl-L-alanine amidase [Actinomycetota bacterium]